MMLLQGKGLCKGSPGFSSGGSKLSAKTLPSSRLRLLSSVNKAMSPRQHSSGANGGPPALLLEVGTGTSCKSMLTSHSVVSTVLYPDNVGGS
eukprot:scaffold287775_cov14-Tisochrysis_lutea.AAC.1